MYAYRPLSLTALVRIMSHTVNGPEARFQRYAARMLWVMASGQHIDPKQSRTFADELEEVYKNPFEKAVTTAQSVIDHVLKRLTE